MATSDERREVAERLRDTVGRLIDMGGLAEILGFHRCSWSAGMLADRIADLIEPSCDRDALLALADEMDAYTECDDERCGKEMPPSTIHDFASRIREALGVGK